MTHIIPKAPTRSLAPMRFNLPGLTMRRPTLPRLGIGGAVLKLTQVIAEAYALAYAAPFGLRPAQPMRREERDEDGRDPNW